ncbi:uncharacterized protein LOC114946420 [Nylanderia fulva]|uniref:uncharacterized protein LOC114946420 n=1 Tax=Nylanderia fulva TaxID=613905 RepID=UPI0010FAD52A|nr:uncharacterized protein LOC114946420 [Nylanderia fulva]
MANVRNAVLDYVDCISERKKVVSLKRRHNTANLRISFRINWIAILTITMSILLCQFAESVAERQASSSHGGRKHYAHCANRRIGPSLRRSLTPVKHTFQSVAENTTDMSQDILSRLEAAVVLRGNLITALGRVLLSCLDDDARVPFELVHDTVRNRQVAVYELLPIVPALQNKLPKQQLYKLLQMLERVIGNRFVSEYASLCINVFQDISAVVEEASLADMLLNVDPDTIESISRDKYRPLSLTRDITSLLQAASNDTAILNLRIVAAILENYPAFDLTDPEVHDAVTFVAERMRERSREEDSLLRYIESKLDDVTDFLRTILERLEMDKLSSKATQEAISLLLQNLDAEFYSFTARWNDPRKLLMITSNDYPVDVTAVAKYLADNLNDSLLQDLDIAFYETDGHALLQMLSRLRRKSGLQHLSKPLSLLTSFVSQKLIYDDNYAYTAPVSQYEVNNYMDSFDTPCLQQNISDAMETLRPHLSKDLPWTYAFGNRLVSDNPWELTLLSLSRLRNIPISKPRAIAIDNFIYKNRALTGRRNPLYDFGIIFQRNDSTDVEVDLFSLLTRIPNAFRSEKFAPMLNFLSKPNILDILGYGFNKFKYDTPRSLLLAVLKRALTLASVRFDESLSEALQKACNYLEEPLLINMYTSEGLQLLLKHLPGIESDPRYLPLKILFKKKKLFTYLSPNFSLAGVHSPMERLLLILRTVSLKNDQPILSEALQFTLENIGGSPLPIKSFDRVDFVYLIQQLLSRDSTLQNEILNSTVYTKVGEWKISIGGTPETILAKILSYPVNDIASDGHLANIVTQAMSILEEDLRNIEILKKQMLEEMLEYLPNNTYAKPVILLLKKSNLMTLVPDLNLTMLEEVSPRDALIILLKSFTESRAIRAEKLLLRRIRAALSFLDGNDQFHQTPIYAYLFQSLQDPNNVVYKPLLRQVSELQVIISPDERQDWLEKYLEEIVVKKKTKLSRAALMALKEIRYDENSDEESRASKTRIKEAVLFLPDESFAKPLQKLLTPEWAYDVLPEELRNSNSLEKKELLLEILHHAKRRTDVIDNLALMRIISKVETRLNGWKAEVEKLKSAVSAAKAAIYDPVKNLLTATRLNKIKLNVPLGKSAKASLLGLLHRLLQHPVITQNNKVFEMLSAIRQDVFSFGVDVDLLTVLDDAGIAYTRELAPIRLFLHRRDFNEKFGSTIFTIADPGKRYRTLLNILQKQRQINNDTRFHDALSILRNIDPVSGESAGTLISDLDDVVNSIPHHVRQQFKSIEQLFSVNVLSRFTGDNEIVESNAPLTVLLSKIANLPEIRGNRTAMHELKKLRSKIKQLDNHSIITGYQLRPLLVELEHVQQINVDYLNFILDSEVLSYLNPEIFSDMFEDSIEILGTIVDYLLYEETMHSDYIVRKHLQSLKNALAFTTGSGKTSSKRYLMKKDWEQMLVLIPRKRNFTPIKIFLQSEEIYKYIPKDTNWNLFSTPDKKLLHLLSLIESSDIENKNIYRSANELRDNLENRFNFITERDIKSMHRALTSLKLNYDLTPLKIFLNHDTLIKYLSPDFNYTKYGASINGLAAVLDNFLRSPSLKHRTTLYETMNFVRKSIREQVNSGRRSSRKTSHDQLSSEDLEFISSLNISQPLREFFKPKNLLTVLPRSFTLNNRLTYKTKTLHLLRQLLQLNNKDIYSELQRLVREVETYPDVPNIVQDDLTPLLNVIPIEGIPYVKLIKKYLKPVTLIKLLPGYFNLKRMLNAKVALHNLLSLLRLTLGSAMSDKLKTALDALISELAKVSSNVIPEEAVVDSNEIKSIVEEIPFQQYKQIEPLKAQMTTAKIISSLPTNFQLTDYKTKKLRVLAVLNELSKSNVFQPWQESMNFARNIIGKMPNAPAVNDTEIERLLLPLPLSTYNVELLITNCKLAKLMPYLPIHFDFADLGSRKMKLAKIMRYCKKAYPMDMSTKQALTNAEATLNMAPDIDITSEHVRVLIRAIPCVHFTLIKPLLRFLSMTDISSLLPWDLDVYRASRTFKLRVLDLLAALRNVKELQSSEMFSALDYLETNTKSLPEQVEIPQDRITVLNQTEIMNFAPCASYRDFVLKTENLIQILPSNYRFRTSSTTVHNEWALITHMSSLFLRDVQNGAMTNAFKACMDNKLKHDKEQFSQQIVADLNSMSYQQFLALRIYFISHDNVLTAPLDVYRSFFQGTIQAMVRVIMREFIRRPELIGSKAVIDDMEVYLHDTVMLKIAQDQTKSYDEQLTPYDVDLAIAEIPNDHKYDDLRVLMRCQEIQLPVVQKTLLPDDTPKQLLMTLLETTEKDDLDKKIRRSIEALKPIVAQAIREEEVELVLKQIPNYRYHTSKLQNIRKYLARVGLQFVLINSTNTTLYPTYNESLYMLNEHLLKGVTDQPKDDEFKTELNYLNSTLYDNTKVEHIVSRTMNDINVQALFFALPKTKDERIIRGIIKFFSLPDLLHQLNLPKNPFEYSTKGQLLQAILDLGQELTSVQRDPEQQEALEYFRDKIITSGPGAQPLELKKDARDSNMDVDMYGLWRAIDTTKHPDLWNVTLLLRKYDKLVYAMSLDHMTYSTRGAYLKALLEHLVNLSHVPDEAKEWIRNLIPAVRLDGPGASDVDLNVDVVHEEMIKPQLRMFFNVAPRNFKSRALAPSNRFGGEIVSHSFQENKESLKAAVDHIFDTISSSEEENLWQTFGQRFNSTRNEKNPSRFKKTTTSGSSSKLNLKITNHPKTKNMKNDRSTTSSLDDILFKVPVNNKAVQRETEIKSENNSNKKSNNLDYLDNESADSSIKARKVKSLQTRKSPSEKLSKTSRNRKRHELMSQNVLLQSDTSIDNEDEDLNESAPIGRMLSDMLLKDEENRFLIRELIEEANIGERTKTVKKDLSRHARKERSEEGKIYENR